MGKAGGSSRQVSKRNSSPPHSIDTSFPYEEIERLQIKNSQVNVPWRQLIGVLTVFLIAHLSIALYFIQDVDPGYTYRAHYDNIGNIQFTTDAPFMGYPPIDVVYTWVNGSDPRWKREKDHWHRRWKAQISGEIFDETDESMVHDASAAATDNRFRDNEELRYSLRSIEMYAPWVRHVYLVTDGQIPNWLNVDSPRITIVPHRDIFANKSHLPVFSSPAIESNLDNIPGLSSLFLYFNDDVFLGAPVQPEDFISPSGVQNIYLSWEVPECSSGCKESFLGNKVCDAMCNTSICAYDMGDCGCREIPTEDPLVFDVVCDPIETPTEEDPESTATDSNPVSANPMNCVDGCSWTWIGDGACDAVCNVTECAFDAGDCSLDSLSQLPSVNIDASKDPHALGIQVPLVVDALVVRFEDHFTFLNHVNLDGEDLVRRAVFLEENMTLILVFARRDTSGTITNASLLSIEGEHNETTKEFNLLVLRGERQISSGVYTPHGSEFYDIHLERHLDVENPSQVNLTLTIPYHAVPDWSLTTGISNTMEKSMVSLCPPIVPPEVDEAMEFASIRCKLENQQVIMEWQWQAQFDSTTVYYLDGDICIQNGEIKACLTVFLARNSTLRWVSPIPPHGSMKRRLPPPLPLSGEWNNGENCTSQDWFVNLAGGLSGHCDLNNELHGTIGVIEQVPLQPDPEVIKNAKAMCSTIAKRLKDNSDDESYLGSKIRNVFLSVKTLLGVNKIETMDVPRHHMLSIDDVTACEDYFTQNPIELPTLRKDEHAATSTDTFGDSLRFVNKLYNAKFGKIDGEFRRRVPSHMPHFIQKKYLTEMKREWEAEFNATSSHRFRHPKDMQFSFSYMYYIVNRNKIHPPTLEEIYDTYIDINHDGMIDEHEALSIASLLTKDEHPSETDIAQVKECITPATTETKRDETRREGIVTITESTQPYLTLESLRLCENVTTRLVQTAIDRLPPTHVMKSEDQVTFHMLSDQYRTAWNQLLNTRAKRSKFICINDDMKYPSISVGNILNDLFTSFWPHRSQFELPYHLKNRFDHVDELASNQTTIWFIGSLSIGFISLILIACFWEPRKPSVNSSNSQTTTVTTNDTVSKTVTT